MTMYALCSVHYPSRGPKQKDDGLISTMYLYLNRFLIYLFNNINFIIKKHNMKILKTLMYKIM